MDDSVARCELVSALNLPKDQRIFALGVHLLRTDSLFYREKQLPVFARPHDARRSKGYRRPAMARRTEPRVMARADVWCPVLARR
jgi:hypothetical protein